MKRRFLAFIISCLLLCTHSMPLVSNAASSDEYGSTATFTTTPNKWRYVPSSWYSTTPVDNTLVIQIKGKKPLNKVRYRLEDKKWTTVNLQNKNWTYNSSTGFSTLNLSIKEMEGFFDVEVYDTNTSARKIKVTLKGKINKTPVINSINRVSATSVKINWKKINYDLDVDIWRSTSLNGTYKRIARVFISDGGYTDKNLVSGKKYYYKFRYSQGAWDKIYSKYTNIKQVSSNTLPKKVTWDYLKSPAKKQISMKWNKVSAAERYQCQISKKSDFSASTSQKTYSANVSLPLKLTGLKSGTTYYVRVRGYSNSGGTRYNGMWSNVKKITVK